MKKLNLIICSTLLSLNCWSALPEYLKCFSLKSANQNGLIQLAVFKKHTDTMWRGRIKSLGWSSIQNFVVEDNTGESALENILVYNQFYFIKVRRELDPVFRLPNGSLSGFFNFKNNKEKLICDFYHKISSQMFDTTEDKKAIIELIKD